MSFPERSRLDLGFGGTSFGYENIQSFDGERFICYGDGYSDQMFIPNSGDRIIIRRSIYGEEMLDAKYNMDGDLIETGVLLEPYYNRYIKIEGVQIDPVIKRELGDITNYGEEPAFCYINLQSRTVGFISGDEKNPEENYYDIMPFLTEFNGDTEVVVPIPEIFSDDNGSIFEYPDDEYEPPSDEITLVKYTVDEKYLNILFKVNSEDYITQPVIRRFDPKILEKTPTPKRVRDALIGVFPKNIF